MSVEQEHSDMVRVLVKDPIEIMKSLDWVKVDLIHATMGIVGEAGELDDQIKKHVIYDKELDRNNVIEELGDMEFYMEQLRQTLGIEREQTLRCNMEKLAKRYPNYKYSDHHAAARLDKE